MTARASAPEANSTPQHLTKLKAFAMLVGALGMSAGFLVLCGALKNQEFYAGFIFLLGWQVFERGQNARLPHAILGCAFGIAMCYALQYLIGNAVPMGGLIFTAVVAVALYCQFLGWLPLIANMSTFTCLLVFTIPHVQKHGNFLDIGIALAVGIVYFTPIIAIVKHFFMKSPAH
jgi:hypothetical protein